MWKSMELHTDDEAFTLGTIFGSPAMTWLEVDKDTTWDNVEYLIEEVWPYLKGERIDKELDALFCGNKEELLEMFNEAEKLGFFEGYKY